MTLADWLEKQKPRRGALTRLARSLGDRVSLSTLRRVLNGQPVGTWEKAAAISRATGGKVTALELCEPNGRQRR